MFWRTIEAATLFDWISPSWAILRDVHARLFDAGSHAFYIDRRCGLTGREIIQHLRRHGIKTYGHLIFKEHLRLAVPRPQTAYANHLLDRLGVTVEYGTVPHTNQATPNNCPYATCSAPATCNETLPPPPREPAQVSTTRNLIEMTNSFFEFLGKL